VTGRDRRTLRAALLEAGVPPESFQLAGVHEHAPIPTDFWFVRPTPGGRWQIGAYERGVYDVREEFRTEAQACDRLYSIMMSGA
jgi:hypothetical protein